MLSHALLRYRVIAVALLAATDDRLSIPVTRCAYILLKDVIPIDHLAYGRKFVLTVSYYLAASAAVVLVQLVILVSCIADRFIKFAHETMVPCMLAFFLVNVAGTCGQRSNEHERRNENNNELFHVFSPLIFTFEF